MHKQDIETLIAYNFWADNEILNACEHLSLAEFTRQATPDPGWHSLRGTLVHLLDTEYGWRVALQNLPDAGVMNEADFPDVASLSTLAGRSSSLACHHCRPGRRGAKCRVARRRNDSADALANNPARNKRRHPSPQRSSRHAHRLRALPRRAGF